ncbi:MAG: 30S ribosomal protein S1 [Planctomycetota bacterium]|jgi:small subunit ribosomal protein S1|nr:30S ribosomal protein S1 [Planctomycetota bacterium]
MINDNKDLLTRFALSDDDLDAVVADAMGSLGEDEIETRYEQSVRDFAPNALISGKVLRVVADDVMVDIGYKSEGVVPLYEFDNLEAPDAGTEIEVLMEGMDDSSGLLLLSRRRAERLRGWERIVSSHGEGDILKGEAIRKIKGGLLLDVGGVAVFLPASQIDIRRVPDVATFIGRDLECKIIKIDRERMNIVVSRRKLLEERRNRLRDDLLEDLEEGQIRTGTVKNIADFGAFLDIGGVDGLLHITDMSWGRVNHPSECVALEQQLEVKVLRFDRERNRIALGLKQLESSPWEEIEKKYPVGSRVRGEVVNIMPYGAFVKIEDGIEGLVHISEMSWTRRVNHPSELVEIGGEVDVVVLEINKDKQEISLGMKQTEVNPWTEVEERYPVGTIIEGVVRNLTNYGAFVEIEEGIDGLLHVSDMSWTKKVSHPSDNIQKGDLVRAVVLSVDTDKRRVALGMKQLEQDPWQDEIPRRYGPGDIVAGRVTKITNFGVFVSLEDGLEGLLHISELTDKKVESPDDVVRAGQLVDVRVLKVDSEERKIGLSMIGVPQHSHLTEEEQKAEAAANAPEDAASEADSAEEASAEVTEEASAEEVVAEDSGADSGTEEVVAESSAEEPVAAEATDDSVEEASADQDEDDKQDA